MKKVKKKSLSTKEKIRREKLIILPLAIALAAAAIVVNLKLSADSKAVTNFFLVIAALLLITYSAGAFWKIHEDSQKLARKTKADMKIVHRSKIVFQAHNN